MNPAIRRSVPGGQQDNPIEPTEAGIAPLEDRRAWWLILLGLASWSYMSVWAGNAAEVVGFSVGHFVAWTALFLVIGFVVQRLVYRYLRGPARRPQSFAVAAVLLIFLQSWNSSLTDGLDLGLRLATWGATAAIVVLITVRLVPAFPAVTAVFGVLTIFLVGVHYLTALGEAWGALRAEPVMTAVASPVTSELGDFPDVFVVVLDEYTSSEVLAQAFGFDNSDFERGLSSAGMSIVRGARANYTDTKVSVAGLLDGRYPAVGGMGDRSFEDLAEIHSGNNSLFASLDAAGYETHLFDNAWTFTRCGRYVDACHSSLLDELDYLVAARTPFRDLIPWLQLSPWIRESLSQFEGTTELAGTTSDSPRLVYLHALIPHAPMQLRSDCSLDLPGIGSILGVEDTPEARAAYAEQVQCVNSLLTDLAQAAPADAILFFTGDHGVRWVNDPVTGDAKSPFSASTNRGVFTAYRFPGRCGQVPTEGSLMESTDALFTCIGIEFTGDASHDPAQPARFFNGGSGHEGVSEVFDAEIHGGHPQSATAS